MGYSVYDGALPPENTKYPFIYMGDFRQLDTLYKNAVTGSVYPTIHIWHNDEKQRGTVSNMLLDVKKVIYQTEKTANYSWIPQSVETDIRPDKTTKTPLLHGIVMARAIFS